MSLSLGTSALFSRASRHQPRTSLEFLERAQRGIGVAIVRSPSRRAFLALRNHLCPNDELLRITARAIGITARADLRDYFRLDVDANARIDERVSMQSLGATRASSKLS